MPRYVLPKRKPLTIEQVCILIASNTMRRQDDSQPFPEATPFVEVASYDLKDILEAIDKDPDFPMKLLEAFDTWGERWVSEWYGDLAVPLLKEEGDDEEEPFPEKPAKEETDLDFRVK